VNAQAQAAKETGSASSRGKAEAAAPVNKQKSLFDLAIESNNPEAIAIKDKVER
jgi:hypothetical protein